MRPVFTGHAGAFRTRSVGMMLKKGRKMPKKGGRLDVELKGGGCVK
jgi:hypothetical protein